MLCEGWRLSSTSSSSESNSLTWPGLHGFPWHGLHVQDRRAIDISFVYLSIPQDEAMKTIERYCFNPSHVIFQHDKDPKYIAKLTKQWLSMQNLDVLTWPPQSHDLNPIEHV